MPATIGKRRDAPVDPGDDGAVHRAEVVADQPEASESTRSSEASTSTARRRRLTWPAENATSLPGSRFGNQDGSDHGVSTSRETIPCLASASASGTYCVRFEVVCRWPVPMDEQHGRMTSGRERRDQRRLRRLARRPGVRDLAHRDVAVGHEGPLAVEREVLGRGGHDGEADDDPYRQRNCSDMHGCYGRFLNGSMSWAAYPSGTGSPAMPYSFGHSSPGM